MQRETECLVIGTGAAGMWFALQAARFCRVTLITKSVPTESNSRYAQGGIAAVWDESDSYEHHVRDTLVAGAGICRRDAVEITVREGPDRVRELIHLGTEFTRQDGQTDEYDLHREGGHSHRRILHAADVTGAEIVRSLGEACAKHENIELLDNYMAVDLITERWLARRLQAIPPTIENDRVLGAYVLNLKTGEVITYASKVVILATGGAGKVYNFTTNPSVATGDGMAMAYRAGANIANMEFVQFHPTCLFHAKEHSFLISEALRGDGGKLILPDGERFMDGYDSRGELAPRDIVARAIDAEIKRRGLECVYLDMRHLSAQELSHKFPNIDAKLKSLGIDMSKEPIPVVPAAHYFCGGVLTDLSGESSMKNLFAIGEASCTGLHGANRLASNSLLEAMVFAHRAAACIEERWGTQVSVPDLPDWEYGNAVDSDELVVIRHTWSEIRRFMWNFVGIVRTHRRLKRARRRIHLILDEIRTYYWDFKVTGDLIELRNIATVADMVITCALQRRESRGLHFNIDFPESDNRFIGDTVIRKET